MIIEDRYLGLKIKDIEDDLIACSTWIDNKDYNKLVEYLQDIENNIITLREKIEAEL